VWKPANDLKWQLNAECAKSKNSHYINLFFSSNSKEKNFAKNLCFSCPVRSSCLQWALEHKQLWGVWGGNSETELRKTLSVTHTGEEVRKKGPPLCPYCSSQPENLEVTVENLPNGGRWTTAKIVTCLICGFAWKSRTSANAVNAYKKSMQETHKIKKETNIQTSPREDL
jgi:WhiB family redox-sensing transcriptional regulator